MNTTLRVLLLVSLPFFKLFAQPTFYINDTEVSVTTGGLIHVNGDLHHVGQTFASLTNNGTITLKNSTNPGSIYLLSNGGSFTQGNGLYQVEQDWVNDAGITQFIAGTSTVEFYSSTAEQFIRGSQRTEFNNVVLTGTGTGAARRKTILLDTIWTSTTGVLTLNDRELATDSFVFKVKNPSPAAVTNSTTYLSEGFVSSIKASSGMEGSLMRLTNSTSSYLFPVGSAVGTTRYRPIEITPQNAVNANYAVRFVNKDATVDGYNRTAIDTTICSVLPDYYHVINNLDLTTNLTTNTPPASVKVYYDAATDGGVWDGIGNWNAPLAANWNNMGAVTASAATPYNSLEKNSWSTFNNPQYALIRYVPERPVITCIDSICPWNTNNQFTASATGPTFTWTSALGTTITNGQGTSNMAVDWNDTAGFVTVFQTVANGCTSKVSMCKVNIATLPIAAYDTLVKGLFGNNYSFVDSSKRGATFFWDLGDGVTTQEQNPKHLYEAAGTYTVMQVVTNLKGCKDTAYKVIEVGEGLIIPNVFTPNKDGTNDEFYIPNSGVKTFYIEIYDRWGLKVFESSSDEIRWDGRSIAGVMCSDGTYYYNLKAELHSGKEFDVQGFLSLLAGRSKN
ncbi:MAG: gliding motility-associated C-terminal domain-containing protein [Bacteroidetes bacterium]|nr:gliding motility-associated C-terminal domain-containing protein [Bacteroidota bacterium]